jgi:phage tail sheath gpL-like
MAKIVSVILLASMYLLLPSIALSDGTPSCSFAGIVEFNGADVADGTVITAIAEGDKYTTTTPTGYGASTYAIVIQTPSGKYYPEGAEVTFEVNGYAADQTGTWQPGQNIRLDLTVTTASIPAASPKTWLIIALILACIVEVSVVGAVAYIVVRRWNR